MSEFFVFVTLVLFTAFGMNTCSKIVSQTPEPNKTEQHLKNASKTYVMAARDPLNPRYVINPYRPDEKLYVGTVPEGSLMLDPLGSPYVVGP
jgi:hypothetical protein